MFANEFFDRRGISTHFLLKRLLDLVVCGLGILILSPLLLLIAVLIYLDSPGPIFFRQERIGLGRQVFRVWKFRTMVVDAEKRLVDLEAQNESRGGVLFKLKADPRVTRLGQFLRRTSLDELPQLFNVLRGQMSLVGPRPLQLRDCNLAFQADSARFEHRLTVLPGVTGLWQVSGRSELCFDDLLHLDEQYIREWSLMLDLRILLKTVVVVLLRKGAY